MAPWTVEYQPHSLNDIIGQERAVGQIRRFIEEYGQSKRAKKALILNGPPGCGKTSSVVAVSRELGFELFEVNASDKRNKASVEELIGNVLGQQSLFFTKKLILIDEVDGLSGTKDRGGVGALVKEIEKSSFPIIMTANNAYKDKMKALVKKCELIDLSLLKNEDVVRILKKICDSEQVEYQESTLMTIARKAQGDLRGAINDLELVSRYSKKVEEDNVVSLSDREKKVSLMNALMCVLKNKDLEIARHAFTNIEENLDDVFMWLDENMAKEYSGKELVLGYDALSKADLFKGRIRKLQYWRFLVYVNAFMSGGIAISKEESKKKFLSYVRSTRPLTMWIIGNKYHKRKSVAGKLAVHTHCSSKTATESLFYLKKMFEAKSCDKIIKDLDLSEDEVVWLRKV
jgi:replication factor C large subunit